MGTYEQVYVINYDMHDYECSVQWPKGRIESKLYGTLLCREAMAERSLLTPSSSTSQYLSCACSHKDQSMRETYAFISYPLFSDSLVCELTCNSIAGVQAPG